VLRTEHFHLDWTLRFTNTTITIDGQGRQLPWGEHFLPLEVGRHSLQVSYRYLRLSTAGKAAISVDVAENEVVRVCYRSPNSVLLAFLPGKLTVEQPRGLAV
jgi:hypothetical protein